MKLSAYIWAGTLLCTICVGPAVAAPYQASTLHSFCSEANCTDGSGPVGLVADRKGNLFGVANIGGAANVGVVYEVSPTGEGQYTYSVLYSFCTQANCVDGSRPDSSLIIDKNGHLYGTTNEGGAQGLGTAFELTNSGGSWSEQVLYSFCTAADCTDGSLPEAGLAYAGQGAGKPYDGTSPLFGTTNAGGASRFGGTAYELSPGNNGWNEQVLHDFCGDASCSDGSNLEAPLTVGPHGNLFGITFQGGNTGFGTAFELAPSGDSWSETILHVFCQKANCADGEFPASGVAIDGNGGVVGITDEGGVNCVDRDHTGGCGVIWRIATKGGAPRYSVIHAMGQNGNADGADPATAPLLDKKGNIYGVTYFGGANLGGVLFELTGKKLKVLYSFCALSACADGVQPNGLVRGQTGGLFGTTAFGGTGSDPSGTVFALTR